MRGAPKLKDFNRTDKPRERLVALGAPALSDAELLAIILRSGGLYSSAVTLATEVLKKFGSFKGLLDADIKQLLEFHGIGVAKATSIKAVCEISLRMQMVYGQEKVKITKPRDIFCVIRKHVYSKKQEHLYLLSLDAKSVLISTDLITSGTLTETLVHPREVFKKALMKSAASVVLVHNHPSGDPSPSTQDVSLTKRIVKAGVTLGIPLVDHVVVCDDSFVSMKASNYLEAHHMVWDEKGGD